MKRRIKKLVRNNLWVLILLLDIAMLALFTYMMFGWVFEIAQFQIFMSAYTG